ncbi:activator of Hsp90 ATPase-like protein [Georgenia soli]|uniref:Activator of Hsp90 ATPase-like protein n=1 Tax=Georgenia soli TaxID=638953 RepID=A0A2A9EQ76_9MICO|nr:SRPBCC family protein [Georgenia soli]PFG40933.1 activator of Hsp90 ATPase-like protein [Georgenia soli]
MADNVSTCSTDIGALPRTVWTVLTSPELLSRVMFGAAVDSDFVPGSPITFTGEWEGRRFEDHGKILDVDEPRLLRHTHFSPLTGEADVPENYHTVTWRLEEVPGGTRVTLTQDNNPTPEAAEHSTENWRRALAELRHTAELLSG